jgi:hypothetical protein
MPTLGPQSFLQAAENETPLSGATEGPQIFLQAAAKDTFLFDGSPKDDDGAKDDISPYINTAKQTAAQVSSYNYGPYTMNQGGVGGFYNKGLFSPRKFKRRVHTSPWDYADGANPEMKKTDNWAANAPPAAAGAH